jgi:hypothetical protein
MNEEQLKTINTKLSGFFGGTPNINRVFNDDESDWVDVASYVDLPDENLTTFATIGMSKFSSGFETKDGKSIRVELVAIADSMMPEFANMLGACAFNIAQGEYRLHPGVIYPDIVSQFLPKVTTKHMLIIPLVSWPNPIGDLEVGNSVVTWLQAVAVTDAEFQKARSDGNTDDLVRVLGESQIDVTDLDRNSVV